MEATPTTAPTIALVTGANKGIGKEIARGLAAAGMTVLAGARNPQRGEEAVADLRAAGLDVRFVRLDVTDRESVRAAARHVEETFGRLDVLVNNAAITSGRRLPPSQVDPDVMLHVYTTNVFGVVAVTNAMLPLLRRSGAPRIVNVSSEVGSMGLLADPANPWAQYTSLPYGTSKTALNAVTLLYADELREAGIRVNAVNPGYCATDLNGHVGPRSPQEGARIAVRVATTDDYPTRLFVSDDGVMPW